MAISFTSESVKFSPKQKTKLKSWVETVVKKEKKTPHNINYVFSNDEFLLKLNKQFLKHDSYTDIITFDYNEGKKIAGDVFISVDRVKENAKKFKVAAEQELLRVMIHGVLHLCGYKDKSKSDKAEIRKKEDAALVLFKKIK